MENKEKQNNVFIIVLLLIILIVVMLFPQINKYVENITLKDVDYSNNDEEENEIKQLTESDLELFHRPLMRTSNYSKDSYYNLDKFRVNNMSNNDILYNAFLSIEDVVFEKNGTYGCTNTSKKFSKEIMALRIKNVIGKNVNYNLESFNVPDDSNSAYKGKWEYKESDGSFTYYGSCSILEYSSSYYDLEQFIKAEYDDRDVVSYYYVGFAKVDGNSYTIYSDPSLTDALASGTFESISELNDIYNNIDNKKKKIYKYRFKNSICTYNEYCLYEGNWENEL